jgi:hypothetical protein
MIISQDHGRWLPSVLLSAIGQEFYAKPVAWRQPLLRCAWPRAASLSMNAEAALQNGDWMAINRPNNRFFNRAFRLQASTPPAIEHLSFASLDGAQQPHPGGSPRRPSHRRRSAQVKFAAQWLRDCLQPGSQTRGSIEIAAERDGVCIATLRRAKFYIGVRSSKDEKSGAWCWTLPHPEDSHPPVNEARCSNELLEHLEHLHETNDLFGNVAKACVIPPAPPAPACRGARLRCCRAPGSHLSRLPVSVISWVSARKPRKLNKKSGM